MIRAILPTLIATLTRHPRYFPEFEWSDKLWTHNAFRLFGMIFGEYYGIRRSVYANSYGVEIAYTLEAQIALFEVYIRNRLKGLLPRIVVIPQLQLAGLASNGRLPYRFAIAQDTSAQAKDNGGAVTNVNYSHTVTGSNMLMAGHGGLLDGSANNAQPSSWTYNAISFTGLQTAPGSNGTDQCLAYLAVLVAPATGANTAQFTVTKVLTASKQLSGETISYSGCAQTGQPDASAQFTNASYSAATIVVTNTVVASSCWLTGGFVDPDITSAGTQTTQVNLTMFNARAADSNGTVGTGSQALTFNRSGTFPVGAAAMSIAPAAAGGTTTHFLPLLGLGS